MKKVLSFIISGLLTVSALTTNISAKENLWDKFIKYDLCITDYNSLTEQEKDLCHFIYDTEQNSLNTVICERARRTLANDENIGERLKLQQLSDCYGIWDNYAVSDSSHSAKSGWQGFIHCVPDIRHIDSHEAYNEYWLDDFGKTKVIVYDQYPVNAEQPQPFHVTPTNITINAKAPQPQMKFEDGKYVSDDFIEYDGDYYYIKPDNTAVFIKSKYSKAEYEENPQLITDPYIMPNEINGCPITAIAETAFLYAPLTEIQIPETVTVIDSYAFGTCYYLEKLNFPRGLKYMGTKSVCLANIQELTINCPDAYVDSSAFSGNFTELNINVKEIGENAFGGCQMLKSVNFGEAVKKINSKAFTYCNSLESVNFSDNLKAIGQGAFLETSVKSVTINPTVEIIGALPRAIGLFTSSGIEYPQTRPLTNKTVCAFKSDCVIYGYEGTEAESYAKKWNLTFIPLEAVKGDVNFDGNFGISDVVTFQKWLAGDTNAKLSYRKAADLCEDDKLNVFDFMIMKREMLNNS